MNKKELKKTDTEAQNSITRRKALQKMGYAAFASSTMFLLLNNPTKAYAASPTNPGDPGDGGDDDWDGEGNKSLQPRSRDRDSDPWKDDWK